MDKALFAVPFSSQQPYFCGIKMALHRNLKGYLFPAKMGSEEKAKVLSALNTQLKLAFPDAELLSAPFPQELKETFIEMTPDLGGGLVDSKNQLLGAFLGYDHLILSVHTLNRDFKSILDKIQSIEARLDAHMSFAFSSKKGFLTSAPEYSGYGLTLEAFLFCPFLENYPQLPENLKLQPFWKEAKLLCLKTTSSCNQELSELIRSFLQALQTLETAETHARQTALVHKKDELLDKVSKSIALLKGAYQLSFPEALNHLLELKKGFHLDFLTGMAEDPFLRLIQQAQKGHLGTTLHTQDTTDDWLHERASWIQKQLEPIHLKT